MRSSLVHRVVAATGKILQARGPLHHQQQAAFSSWISSGQKASTIGAQEQLLPRIYPSLSLRHYSSSPTLQQSSPFDNSSNSSPPKKKKRKKSFIPRKAAVEMTENARDLFQKLLDNAPPNKHLMLDYQQSTTGQPRMVFSFRFVTNEELHEQDEGVTLEVNDDGTPKTPAETWDDGKPKLYISHNAFLKVLGATVDVERETITPILYDREGNEMDPNA